MTLASEILKETDGKICKHCLGRKLSKTVEGSNNIERADKVCAELDIDLDDVECVICDNIFDKIDDDLYDKIDAKINQLGIEFDAVNDNLPEVQQYFGGNTRKVFANLYWDDRNAALFVDKDKPSSLEPMPLILHENCVLTEEVLYGV